MRSRRSTLILALLTAACGDSTGLEDVVEVRLMPASPYIDVGLSVAFEAEGLDADGRVVDGIEFVWSSSDTSVAVISDEGVAYALEVGTTAITASAGSATPGSQVLVVEPSQCFDRMEVSLAPGAHSTWDGDDCLFIPAGSIGDRYRIAITRPTLIEDPDDVRDMWLRVSPLLSTDEAADRMPPEALLPSPATVGQRRPGIDGSRVARDARILEHTRRFHADLRQREIDAGLALAPVARPSGALALTSGPSLADPPQNDRLYLVLDCEDTNLPTPVVLLGFNDDLVIYQDSAGHAEDPLATTSTDRMLDFYSDYVRDMADEYWGQTPDIDHNGRVILTTTDALPDSAAAAVYSGDFLTTSSCASSNEAEVMYFSTDVLRLMEDDEPSYIALSIMAHEVKHVTSLYDGIARGAFHNRWIEEGTAEVSQVMASRIAWEDVGGPPLGSAITGDDILDAVEANGDEILPEMWGVVVEIADLITTLSTQPNSLITNPEGAAEFHTYYASGWHWYRFIGDAFGGAASPLADAPLFAEMTDSLTPAGVNGLTQVTGESFEELFEDWIVAMSLHEVGPTPDLAFTTWDFVDATSIFASPPAVAPPHRYPWPVTASLNGSPSRTFKAGIYSCPPLVDGDSYRLPEPTERCPIGPSGIRFHDFVSDGTGAGAQIQVFGDPDAVVTVTRLR